MGSAFHGVKSHPPSISVEKNSTSGASSASCGISFSISQPHSTNSRLGFPSGKRQVQQRLSSVNEIGFLGIVSPLKNGGVFARCTQNAVLCTLTHTVLIELLFLLASITHFSAKSKDMRGHRRTSFCTKIPAEILRPGFSSKIQFSNHLHSSSARASIWAREASFRAHFTVTVVSV